MLCYVAHARCASVHAQQPECSFGGHAVVHEALRSTSRQTMLRETVSALFHVLGVCYYHKFSQTSVTRKTVMSCEWNLQIIW